MNATRVGADPATVRPRLAVAAAENLEQLQASLLEAAGSAVKPVWLTVECSGCGERSRIEAPVPDVRARVAAIELLLREGLGRAPQAEETTTPRMPANVAAVKAMGWDEMQALFAATYVNEIAAVQRDGGEALVREKLATLSEGERRVLREALAEPAVRVDHWLTNPREAARLLGSRPEPQLCELGLTVATALPRQVRNRVEPAACGWGTRLFLARTRARADGRCPSPHRRRVVTGGRVARSRRRRRLASGASMRRWWRSG
jgi:hypothetical protein